MTSTVSVLLEQPCNKSDNIDKVVTSCQQLVPILGQAGRTQLFNGLYMRKTHKLLQVCKQVVTNLFTSCQQVAFALFVPSLL